MLRLVLVSFCEYKIIRQAGQQIEGSNHSSVLLTQDDFVPSAKDFNLLAF